MTVGIVAVDSINRKDIPKENETIEDDLEVDHIVPHIKEMVVYFRDKESCPFNRGNWMIDILTYNNQLHCIKLPKEMSEKEVMRYLEPLKTKLESYKLKGMH